MASLRCARCATALPWDSRFCHHCGAAIGAPSAKAPSAEAPRPPLAQALQAELGGEITLREEIGRTPLTVTYAGIEPQKGRAVRVHVVPPEVAREDPGRCERLLRAARATARLRHPRVAPVYRVSAGDRLVWWITAAEPGEILASVMAREKTLPLRRVVEIVGHVAGALACAHEHGTVHGALSPSRVHLDQHGAATVKDFGLTEGREPASPEVDQYALAAMAYEMLSGHASPGPPLSLACPDLPPAVTTVIERAMAQRPTDRYPSIVKFAQAFRNAATGRTSSGARNGPVRKSEVLLPPPAPGAPEGFMAPPSMYAPPRERARRPVLLAALGTGTVLAVLALIAWQSRGNGSLISPDEQQRLLARSRLLERAAAQPAIRTPSPVAAGSTTAAPLTPPAAAPLDSVPAAPTPAPSRSRPAAPQPARAPRREPPARRPEPAPEVSAAVGYVTVGTNPQAAIFIDEQLVPSNPVRNWPVRAGAVFLRFEVMDTLNGVWTQDMTVNVEAGDTLNLRRIRLVHP